MNHNETPLVWNKAGVSQPRCRDQLRSTLFVLFCLVHSALKLTFLSTDNVTFCFEKDLIPSIKLLTCPFTEMLDYSPVFSSLFLKWPLWGWATVVAVGWPGTRESPNCSILKRELFWNIFEGSVDRGWAAVLSCRQHYYDNFVVKILL